METCKGEHHKQEVRTVPRKHNCVIAGNSNTDKESKINSLRTFLCHCLAKHCFSPRSRCACFSVLSILAYVQLLQISAYGVSPSPLWPSLWVWLREPSKQGHLWDAEVWNIHTEEPLSPCAAGPSHVDTSSSRPQRDPSS